MAVLASRTKGDGGWTLGKDTQGVESTMCEMDGTV